MVFSYCLWNAYTDLSLAACLFTFDYAIHCGLGYRGDFKDHRSCHWHASGSGSWVGSPVSCSALFNLLIHSPSSSAVIAIGAATLADIYEPHERGTMMGVYYSAPLLGPSIGPILGGGLTQGLSWRAVFWFLVIWGGVIFSAFLFLFKDTFRKERSLTYQNVLKRRTQERKLEQEEQPIKEKKTSVDGTSGTQTPNSDVEAQPAVVPALAIKEVNLSIADVNPIPPYLRILSRKNNVAILIPSGGYFNVKLDNSDLVVVAGLLFAFSFSIAYTCARTLSLHYDYDAMTTGLVLLAYGIGRYTPNLGN